MLGSKTPIPHYGKSSFEKIVTSTGKLVLTRSPVTFVESSSQYSSKSQPEMTFAYKSHATGTVAPPSEKSSVASIRACKKILFVSNDNEYGGAEKHLLELIRRLRGPGVQLYILSFQTDFYTARLGPDLDIVVITSTKPPQFLWDWVRLFRNIRPDSVVFVYGWFWAFPCAAVVGAWVAGVRRRFSIQHLMTPRVSLPPQVLATLRRGRSLRGRLRGVLRKLLGRQDPPLAHFVWSHPWIAPHR